MTETVSPSVEDCRIVVAEARAAGRMPDLVDALMALAAAQAEAGEEAGSLTSVQEGVDILRGLTEGPEGGGYALAFASALNGLSTRQSAVGFDDDARRTGNEALAWAESCLAAEPDQSRFIIVSALLNQSGRSWRAGDVSQALDEMARAARVFREGGEPMMSFLGGMVDALHRNAMTLSESGCWDEAVRVRRITVDLFPEDGIPAPVHHLLALTLEQAAFGMAREGHPGEALPLAEEACQLAHGLAEVDPAQYGLFLAQSLACLASRQHEAGADAEALESAVEAVGVFQDAARKDAAAVVAPLAATMDTFAAILTSLGHHDQAASVLAQRQTLLGGNASSS